MITSVIQGDNGFQATIVWLTRGEVIERYKFDPETIDPRSIKAKLIVVGAESIRYYLDEACKGVK